LALNVSLYLVPAQVLVHFAFLHISSKNKIKSPVDPRTYTQAREEVIADFINTNPIVTLRERLIWKNPYVVPFRIGEEHLQGSVRRLTGGVLRYAPFEGLDKDFLKVANALPDTVETGIGNAANAARTTAAVAAAAVTGAASGAAKEVVAVAGEGAEYITGVARHAVRRSSDVAQEVSGQVQEKVMSGLETAAAGAETVVGASREGFTPVVATISGAHRKLIRATGKLEVIHAVNSVRHSIATDSRLDSSSSPEQDGTEAGDRTEVRLDGTADALTKNQRRSVLSL
jgi:hypothetical protein